MFAKQRIRTPLTVGDEVAIFQVVAGEALVALSVVVFEYDEGKAGEAVHMHLIRCQPGDGADGIVVIKVYVWQVDVPIVLPSTPVLGLRENLGTDYCYAGVILALLGSLTQGVRRVLGEM